MRERKLFGIIIMIFIIGSLTAQDEGKRNTTLTKIQRLEVEKLLPGKVITGKKPNEKESSVIEESDMLDLLDLPVPDEDLNEFFSEKMDSLMNTWYVKNAFSIDTSEVDLSGYYPTNVPDSVYISRLTEIEEVVELSYNNVVRNFIILYTEKRRDQVERMLGMAEYYYPKFEEILDKHEMPLDLRHLPIIESALNPTARSRVGATGLWQFMFGTARQMDLEITSFVDERRDPIASTEAAVRYFKYLYNRYGDWHLAIAAYNCGPGNVNRAIRRAGGRKNYWAIYYRLPRETRGYVPAFIAAAYVMNYHKEHNLYPRTPEFDVYTDTVMVSDYLHFDQLVATLEIDKEELRSLNPMYRRDIIPAKKDKSYPLILPELKIMEFIDKNTAVFAYNREQYFPDNMLISPGNRSTSNHTPVDIEGKAKVLYTVQRGDNVGFISEWFNVRASDLRYWNNIHRDLIRAGQKLQIYVPENQKENYERINSMSLAQKQAMNGKSISSVSSTSSSNTKPQDSNFIYHTVRRGDTLWEIARNYPGISSDDIVKLNNLKNENDLDIGQKLKIKKKS